METIVSLIRDSVSINSERRALAAQRGYRTEIWTYRHLWEFSGRVSTYLRDQGIESGDRIALKAPNSPRWVAAYLGCLRLGAIVVPLDVRSSRDFVSSVIEKTGPKLAFSESSESKSLDGLSIPTIQLDSLDRLTAGLSRTDGDVTSESIAEVVFTSGTTGSPKGVVLTHGNITANVSSALQTVPGSPNYRLLSLLPLSHMLEQTVGLLAPLASGASVYYPSALRGNVVLPAIKENRITTLVVVPQLLDLFMRGIEARVAEQGKEGTWRTTHHVAKKLPVHLRRLLFRSVHKRLGGSLKFIMCGGAYLDPELAGKWENLGIPVLQGYGTTEASPIVASDTFRSRRRGSVGRAFPGVHVKIAHDGEILVAGANVTSGYWQDKEATRASFEGVWYKTGDLGALDEQGFVHLNGRKKDLIVLPSGLNVYPEDVELALKDHPDVADAAVVGVSDAGRLQVHAVLLLTDGAADARAIVQQSNAKLAEHQRVQGFTVWPFEDLPRTHTLKIKKHEVIEWLSSGGSDVHSASSDEATPVRNESSPLAILAEVAEMQAASLDGSMQLELDLGLDSLKRIELVTALEDGLGITLDESDIAGLSTVEDLENLLSKGGATREETHFADWPLGVLSRTARSVMQPLFLSPVTKVIARPRVSGLENLHGISGPVIFACSHSSHADTPIVMAAMPGRIRNRLVVGAAADYFFEGRMLGFAAGLLWNAFPFSRGGAIKPTLERCGGLLDGNWSLLVYPEGTRSLDGELGMFKTGIGLMAVEFQVPVVPVRVGGSHRVLAKGSSLPRVGSVDVGFGPPLSFAPETSYIEATCSIEDAVRSLADRK